MQPNPTLSPTEINRQEPSQAPSNIPRGLLIAALLIINLWGVATARVFLIPVCISALLALLMMPVIRLMERAYFPEWLAITLCSIFLIVPLPTIIYMLIHQGQSLAQDFPTIVASFNSILKRLSDSNLARNLHLTGFFDPAAISSRLSRAISEGLHIAISSLGALLDSISQIALVLMFSILMLASRRHLRQAGEKILSRSKSIHAPEMLDAVTILIERFLLARILIVLIIAGIDTVILLAFGLPYSFLMGSFLGIMTVVPAIGFIFGVIPPLLVELANNSGISTLILLFLALFAMSFIEGNVLTPKLVGKSLNINTLSTFLGAFAGGLLWGIWGMLLSIPFLGVLRIIFSAVPQLEPWGELLAEKEDKATTTRLRVKG